MNKTMSAIERDEETRTLVFEKMFGKFRKISLKTLILRIE